MMNLSTPWGRLRNMRSIAVLAAILALVSESALGQTWTYEYADLQFGRHTARFVMNEAPPAEVSGRYSARALDAGRQVLEYLPFALASSAPPAAWPAPSGYPTYATPYLEWRYTVKAVGWEDVTVPAGRFKALRVTVTGERGKDPDPFWWPKQAMRFEQTFWYAPDTRRYVKYIHRAWNMNNADFAHERVELQDYRP